MLPAVALAFVALILSVIALFQSKASSLVAWATLALSLVHLGAFWR